MSAVNTGSAPADGAIAITPSDTVDLTNPTRGIYVGVGGDITVNLVGTGATILFKAALQGSVLPIRAKRVLATGTTATNLIGLF